MADRSGNAIATLPQRPAELAAALEGLASSPGEVSDEEVQRVFTAAFKLYAQRAEQTGLGDPFTEANGITATQVVAVSLAILHAQNLEIFELALWQSWGGAPWSRDSGGDQ